jgi:cysteine desulfurase family protein
MQLSDSLDPNSLIYLDNAATSWPKPDLVHDFMARFYRNHGVSPGRSSFDAAHAAADLVEQTRTSYCTFFNSDSPERVIFTANATSGLNLLISGVVREGGHVISTELEHNSVLRPLRHLERDGRCDVTWIPFDEDGFIDPQDILNALRPKTQLVIVNHVSNVLGTVQPVAAIGKELQNHDVLFAVDASQSAGELDIDMREMCVDVLVTTGHKSLLGPTGIGLLVVRDDVEIRITHSGGTGVRSGDRYHVEEYPWRLEAGTLNLMGIAGLNAGHTWILEQGGPVKLHNNKLQLLTKLIEGFDAITGLTVHGSRDMDRHAALISITLDNLAPEEVGMRLDVQHSIAVRTGLHCAPMVHDRLGTTSHGGTIRFSFGPFNDDGDVEAVIEALQKLSSV